MWRRFLKKPSKPGDPWADTRARIIGLGERSVRKSHYPVLQKRLRDLERFRLLLEQTAEAILVAEVGEWRIVDANQSAEKHLFLTREELLSRDLRSLLPDPLRVFLDPEMGRQDDPQAPVRGDFIRGDGSIFHAEVNAHYGELDSNRFLVLTARDISAQLRAESALREAKEEAEYANMAKSRFLANVSHELRTPLNAVIGFAEMIESCLYGPLGDERYGDYARDIQDSGRHLLQLITDLLDLSRIEVGAFDLNEEAIDLAELTASAIKLVEGYAGRARIAIENCVDAEAPKLYADPLRIKQALINLLMNGVKFNRDGGAVRVSVSEVEDGGIAVEVSDTGIGIRHDVIPHILEPFGRSDDPLIRSHEGAGLGLHLVKNLVEVHGGEIRIESDPGIGTRIRLRFPEHRVIRNRDA